MTIYCINNGGLYYQLSGGWGKSKNHLKTWRTTDFFEAKQMARELSGEVEEI